MKKLITSVVLLFFTITSYAVTLEAKSIKELIKEIQNADLSYRETGKIFGFISTQSCLYTSDNIAIFKNYCYPVRDYPARGYTIISKEFGTIDLYEEKHPEVLKRDIQITTFPEILEPYLTTSFPSSTLNGLSSMLEKVHYNYFPGCWSTNFSFYTGSEDVNCNIDLGNVLNMSAWSEETQSIVMDERIWLDLMERIETKLRSSP